MPALGRNLTAKRKSRPLTARSGWLFCWPERAPTSFFSRSLCPLRSPLAKPGDQINDDEVHKAVAGSVCKWARANRLENDSSLICPDRGLLQLRRQTLIDRLRGRLGRDALRSAARTGRERGKQTPVSREQQTAPVWARSRWELASGRVEVDRWHEQTSERQQDRCGLGRPHGHNKQ